MGDFMELPVLVSAGAGSLKGLDALGGDEPVSRVSSEDLD